MCVCLELCVTVCMCDVCAMYMQVFLSACMPVVCASSFFVVYFVCEYMCMFVCVCVHVSVCVCFTNCCYLFNVQF